tara:strand:- start:5102 stop:6529 length:1428 start_codon:yes stop_codon:yes gene_type:complete
MHNPHGFKTIEKVDRSYIDPSTRIKNFKEFVIPLSDNKVKKQSERCMSCGIPFCHNGCPVNNLIPDWNDLVYNNKWQEALNLLHSTNNFPEFTGRICPAPCEAACVLNITDKPVSIKSIECTIVDKGWEMGWITPQPPKILTGKKVAVIGSGPAGLACAQQLGRAGHLVSVYEKNSRIGGLLRIGIPDFKMEKHLIDRRIEQMKSENVAFVTNIEVGKDLTAQSLLDYYDAVAICIGSEVPRNLPVEGREHDGIYYAMQFLSQQNDRIAGEFINREKEIHAKGKNVLVIGGGDTGSDCVGTSIRQGAANVQQLEVMPQPPAVENKKLEWPNWPMKLRTSSSHQEMGQQGRKWSVLTKRFEGGPNGQVKKLHCVNVEWTNKNGKMIMKEIENTEFSIEADLVFLAMGFVHPVHEGLIKDLKLQLDPRGNILADDSAFKTNAEKLFVAGDSRRGQSLVVWAIREGRDCAESINNFLK